MKKILSFLQDRLAGLRCEYADLRYVEVERTRIRTKNQSLEEVKETFSRGVGFRVLSGGTFGFSATRDLSQKNLLRHLNQARQMAKGFSAIRHAEIKLVPVKPVRAKWIMPVEKDPWTLSTQAKAEPVFRAAEELKRHSWVRSASGFLDFTKKKIIFISSEGSRIEQVLYRTGGWIHAEAPLSKSAAANKIRRSWPGPSGSYFSQGCEAIEAMKFEAQAPRIAEELKELQRAGEAPRGTYDLILTGSVLALQIHETFGHAAESDRVYGYEDNFGGRTFLNPGFLGGFSVASPAVHLASSALMDLGPGAGSFAYDDEGVPAKSVPVIHNGIFRGYLTSRETASFLNQRASSANMVARDWSHFPIIRMTNVNLLPGKGTLAEMISETRDGFLLDNEMSWSIDEMRLDFQIGAEAGFKIRNGKIKGLVRFPFYHGNSLDFWRSCDRVAGKGEWKFWGFPDCGKGGPYQEAFTGHGLAPARFRQVAFGRE